MKINVHAADWFKLQFQSFKGICLDPELYMHRNSCTLMVCFLASLELSPP